MDLIITLMRIPIGLIGTVFALVIGIPVETIFTIICFPFAALFMSRDQIKSSWIGKYPNSLRKIRGIWHWVSAD